jgi:hypothetical protein
MIHTHYDNKKKSIYCISREDYKKKRWEEFQSKPFLSIENMSIGIIKEKIKNSEAKHHEQVKMEYEKIFQEYISALRNVEHEFEEALAKEYLNNPNHPKRNDLYNLALERGHSGFYDLECAYSEMAVLLN